MPTRTTHETEPTTVADPDRKAADPAHLEGEGIGDSVQIAIDALLPADSPRLEGEHPEHIRALAEVAGELPPILVHSGSLRVIDGMHRVRAAQLNGQEEIKARLFNGSVAHAFVLAVEANTAHGLPLSRADREAAAARILVEQCSLSDRAVAAVAGLSAGTVSAIRRRVTKDAAQPAARRGRDGRLRPLDNGAGRQLARELIAARPGASLREIAKEAGVSPTTVQDVRERMRNGEDPVPNRRRTNNSGHRDAAPYGGQQPAADAGTGPGAARRELAEILASLGKDPSLRLTENGRELLRWFGHHARAMAGWERRLDALPAHCAYPIAQLATACAHEWLELARHVELQAGESHRANHNAAPPDR